MNNNSRIYEGMIANHDHDPFYGQIVINNRSGLIKEVIEGKKHDNPTQIFGNGKIIFPGMSDIHIHARDDESGTQRYKETYTTALNAALNGGVVFTAAMPNTGEPLVTLDRFRWHRDRIKEIDHPVNLLNYIGIGNGTKPIGHPGEHPYKAYFGKSVGDLTFFDEHELEETIKFYSKHDISFHVEYEPFIIASSDGRTHSQRRPIGAINHGLKLLLPIIEKYGINAKLCHWSTGGQSFKMIKEHREKAKKEGLPYTEIEVSPLHLMFDTEMTDVDPSLWLQTQMNPALQGKEHRMQLIEGLRNGFIDHLATDHAPHTEEEKYIAFLNKYGKEYPNMSGKEIAEAIKELSINDFHDTCCENNTSGAPWLDTYSNVAVWLMTEHNFKPQDIARVTGYNPGKFVNKYLHNQYEGVKFGEGFGKIEKDYVGSLTVLNTDTPVTIDRKNLHTKCKWSPLEGTEFSGGLEAVIIRGENMTNKFKQPDLFDLMH